MSTQIDDIMVELDAVLGAAVNHMTFQTSNVTVGHWIADLAADDPDLFGYDLDAPYQRGSVWTLDQRRHLIRSLLIGIPIAALCVATSGDPTRGARIVDGKQRLETIRAFRRDEFSIPARWVASGRLGATAPAEVVWSQLDRKTRQTIERRQLPMIEFRSDARVEVDPGTGDFVRGVDAAGHDRGALWRPLSAADQLRYERCVYLLLNTGGTPHTAADLEHSATS